MKGNSIISITGYAS